MVRRRRAKARRPKTPAPRGDVVRIVDMDRQLLSCTRAELERMAVDPEAAAYSVLGAKSLLAAIDAAGGGESGDLGEAVRAWKELGGRIERADLLEQRHRDAMELIRERHALGLKDTEGQTIEIHVGDAQLSNGETPELREARVRAEIAAEDAAMRLDDDSSDAERERVRGLQREAARLGSSSEPDPAAQ